MKRAALALLVLLAGCQTGEFLPEGPEGPWRPPTPTGIPEVSSFFLMEQMTRRKVDGLTLRIYTTPPLMVRGNLLSDIKSGMARVKAELPIFVIKHPKQGYVLFDPGLNPKVGSPKVPVLPVLAAKLSAGGIAADEVKWIIFSTPRADRADWLAAFPQATGILEKREASPAERLKLIDVLREPGMGTFDHALDLFEDGTMYAIDFSGLGHGTLGLWVSLDAAPVLLAGGASWVLDNHQDLALPEKSAIKNISMYWRRLHQMKKMQEAVPQLVIFPAHDLGPLKLQPRDDVRLAE